MVAQHRGVELLEMRELHRRSRPLSNLVVTAPIATATLAATVVIMKNRILIKSSCQRLESSSDSRVFWEMLCITCCQWVIVCALSGLYMIRLRRYFSLTSDVGWPTIFLWTLCALNGLYMGGIGATVVYFDVGWPAAHLRTLCALSRFYMVWLGAIVAYFRHTFGSSL
jgi:hypothetical protein